MEFGAVNDIRGTERGRRFGNGIRNARSGWISAISGKAPSFGAGTPKLTITRPSTFRAFCLVLSTVDRPNPSCHMPVRRIHSWLQAPFARELSGHAPWRFYYVRASSYAFSTPIRRPAKHARVFSCGLDNASKNTKNGAREHKGRKQASVRDQRLSERVLSRQQRTQLAPPRASGQELWQTQKNALEKKFGKTGWMPRKRLSPDALERIRSLHIQDPERNSTEILANQFEVSPEAIRRILKSRWRPSEEEQVDRLRRWDRRGERIWSELAESGIRPPRRWRKFGIKASAGPKSQILSGTETVPENAPSTKHANARERPSHYAGSLAGRIL